MSHLLTKSQENLQAAQILKNRSLFASSIHCSYYSCVQLMKHTLMQKMNKTSDEIDTESNGEGSHQWLIKEIFNILFFDKNDWNTANNFNIGVNELKKLRMKADYKNKLIVASDSQNGIEKANNTNSILNTIL